MTNFLNVLSLIIKLLPLIKEAVVSLESAFPDSGNGAAKKAILSSVLDQAIVVTGEVNEVYEKAKPSLSFIIDAVVALVKKKPVEAVAPVVAPAVAETPAV